MFNGPEYDSLSDFKRLKTQQDRIKAVMSDQQWRTLEQIAKLTGDHEASISAQLRHLRKIKFGAYIVERRPHGDRAFGLFEYRVVENGNGKQGELF